MVYYDRPTRFASDVEDRIVKTVHALMPNTFRVPAVVDPMAKAPLAVPYTDHSNLSVVRAADGSERQISTASDWNLRVAHIRANMQQAMGPLPGPERWAPLDPSIVSEERTEHYLRRKIRFTPEPGDRVPAWLLIPNSISKIGRAHV